MSRTIFYFVAGAFLLGAAATLYWFDPLCAAFFPRCPLHLMFDLYCPGCGTLRAIHALLHGDIANAMAMNPLMVVSIPVIGLFVLRPAWAARTWVPWVCFGVLIVYGILRNIPFGIFSVLAPH